MKHWHPPTILILMALSLALFQLGGALLPVLVGALLFGAFALLRPDLGLLFVPLTAPLYLIPAAIQGLRADTADPFRLPTYEAALLAVLGATLASWLWRRATDDRRPTTDDQFRATHNAQYVLRYAPQLLFLLGGALGVLLAAERSRALREFRWLIAEPLIFYALLKLQLAGHAPQESGPNTESQPGNSSSSSQFSKYILAAFILSGALVGLLGLLQFAGLDLVPLLGRKQCFAPDGGPCANIVADGGVRRVLSVYGHPNNLGLYLGRVWPLAAMLAVAAWNKNQRATNKSAPMPGAHTTGMKTGQRFSILNSQFSILNSAWLPVLFFVLCSLFSLGGILVSFSRGAWLGAAAALAVLVFGLTRDVRRMTSGWWSVVGGRWSVVGIAALAVIGGLALTLRGDVTAGSTPIRLLLWREAAGYIWRHPLGIGLDQFGFYHDPAHADLSLIDPMLIGTSEQYAAHPHNLLLDIWLRMGPLGLLAFGWLLARFARDAWRAARAPAASWPLALGALAAMVAALIHGMVDNFYFVPDLAIAFWLLLALKVNDEGVTK